MLLVEPAFLPLQPLPGTNYATTQSAHSTLPASCSINSLRRSFHPFPLRPAAVRTPSERQQVLVATENWWPASPVTVRAMRSADVDRIKRLQAECLPLAYPASFYTLLLTKPASLCVVASTPAAPSVPLGCASGHVLPYTQCPLSSTDDDDDDDDERSARTTELPMIYLTSLAVDPIARNQGLGRQLVNELVHGLLASPSASSLAGRPRQRAVVQLHVEATNEAAIRLYKRLGLSETRRIRGYYKGLRGSGDAIEMKGVLFV